MAEGGAYRKVRGSGGHIEKTVRGGESIFFTAKRRQATSRRRLRKWLRKSYRPVTVEKISLTMPMRSASVTSLTEGYLLLSICSSPGLFYE